MIELNRQVKQLIEARDRLREIGGFYSSKWNFIKRLEISNFGEPESYLLFGSGPFIYTFNEEHGPGNCRSFELESRLCVFEATGTNVEGVEYLHNSYWLAWGGSYFAIICFQKLFMGGTLCQQDVLSTGKQIVTAKIFKNMPSPTVFELYFFDGTMREVMCKGMKTYFTLNDYLKQSVPSMTPYNIYRLPLRPGETVTAGYTGSFGTQLGTSHGRVISIKNTRVQFASEPILDIPIKRIVTWAGKMYADVPTLLLFENGSIVSWKKDKNFVELKGRYTCISEFIFALDDDVAQREKYILAGDRDGTVTIIRVDNCVLEILRIFRNRTFSSINDMILLNRDVAILATDSGELQLFDMMQLNCVQPYFPILNNTLVVFKDENETPPPLCVVCSDYYYKTTNGWFFLKDDKFCKAFKGNVKYMKTKQTVVFSEGKKMKMKYLVCSSDTDREIAIAYTRTQFDCCVTDYSSKKPRVMEQPGHSFASQDGKPLRIIQVILMKSHFLLQYDSGITHLSFIDMTHTKLIPIAVRKRLLSRITAAACIENDDKKDVASRLSALMLTYLDGTAEVVTCEWFKDGSLDLQHFVQYVADLKGSYFVSAIASLKYIGEKQCLLLSRKGILYLAASGSWFGLTEKLYATVFQRDASGILGRGHSLHETSFGILAAGFKRHTLHVCRVAMKIPPTREYVVHLFSVDTRSSRLPYTIIEEKNPIDRQGGRKTTNQLIVSYYNPDSRVTEDRFSCYDETVVYLNGGQHTGIISNCHIDYGFDENHAYIDNFFSGDSNGNFCIWSFNEAAVTGLTTLGSFNLNGAVTAIREISSYMAVATSTGDLHLFKQVKNSEYIQLLPTIPINLGQKITSIGSGQNPNTRQAFALAFLANGTVKHIKINRNVVYEAKMENIVTIKTVAKYPVAIKTSTCNFSNLKKVYYLTALGVDGILRRTELSAKPTTVVMKWKISAMKVYAGTSGAVTIPFLLIGDPQGWVYLMMIAQQLETMFYIDQLHKHEVIDVNYRMASEKEWFLFSLDITGTVIIRKIFVDLQKPENRPIIWNSAIQSPRKMVVREGKRQIMVVGKGIATRSY